MFFSSLQLFRKSASGRLTFLCLPVVDDKAQIFKPEKKWQNCCLVKATKLLFIKLSNHEKASFFSRCVIGCDGYLHFKFRQLKCASACR